MTLSPRSSGELYQPAINYDPVTATLKRAIYVASSLSAVSKITYLKNTKFIKHTKLTLSYVFTYTYDCGLYQLLQPHIKFCNTLV